MSPLLLTKSSAWNLRSHVINRTADHMPNIDTEAVRHEIAELAAASVSDHAHVAIREGNSLFANAQQQLQKYSDQLARGEIDKDQLEEDLREDLLALANMDSLKQAGLGELRVAAFTNGVVNILIRAAIGSII
jgi:hypothetical protein